MKKLTTFLHNNKAEVCSNFIKKIYFSNKMMVKERNRKTMRFISKITWGLLMFSYSGITAFALNDREDTFNTIVQYIADFVSSSGMVIGFIGAVQFTIGLRDNSTDSKTRGLICFISGLIIFAVAKASNLFMQPILFALNIIQGDVSMSLKKKIFYSFDLGLFVTGIILLYLGSEKVEIRLDLGLILISFSYFLFPFIDRNKKEKHFTIFGLHFLAFVICLVTFYGVFIFYNKNPNGTIWWKELLTVTIHTLT